MIEAALAFICALSPEWIFMIFPLLGAGLGVFCWWECRKETELKANPHRMTGGEYMNFNTDRFNK